VRGSVLATLVLDASTDQLVETFEPRLQQPVTGAQGVWVNVDETRRTIIMRVIR
jgi:predicted component of type VI protein secretion system